MINRDKSQHLVYFYLSPFSFQCLSGANSKVHHMTSIYTDLDVLDNHLVLVVPLVQVNLYMNPCYQVVLGALQSLYFLYASLNKTINR